MQVTRAFFLMNNLTDELVEMLLRKLIRRAGELTLSAALD
jgi:hypothetical protein